MDFQSHMGKQTVLMHIATDQQTCQVGSLRHRKLRRPAQPLNYLHMKPVTQSMVLGWSLLKQLPSRASRAWQQGCRKWTSRGQACSWSMWQTWQPLLWRSPEHLRGLLRPSRRSQLPPLQEHRMAARGCQAARLTALMSSQHLRSLCQKHGFQSHQVCLSCDPCQPPFSELNQGKNGLRLSSGWSAYSHIEGELHPGVESKDVASLDLKAAQQLVVQLQASLQARELQLERKQEEVASMQDTTQQVMVRLARRAGTVLVSTSEWVAKTDMRGFILKKALFG